MGSREHTMHHAPGDREVTTDLLKRFSEPSSGFRLAVIVFAILFVAGIVGLALRLSAGLPNTRAWGYYAAVFAFLLSTVMAAPIIPTGLLFTKAIWPRPMAQAAMLFAVPGILWGLMFLPLLGALPPLEGRTTMWFAAPVAVMRWVDTLAVFSLVLLGLVLLYVRSRPDWATLRDQGGGMAAGLARGWRGTEREWRLTQAGMSLLGVAYLFLYAYVTMLITMDFDMSLVPGWRSAIYPAYHVVTSLEAGVATIVITLALLRSVAGLRAYLKLDQFWALGKLQLALALLWFYFFWSEFIVVWYGRTPREQTLIQIFNFGPYFPAFLLTVVFAFAVPFLLLIWNPIRKSIAGPTVAATSVLIGIFFDRIRLYVPAYEIAGVGGAAAEQVPAVRLPDTPDVLMILGALAGIVLLYLLATRLLPAVSIWEMRVYLMLTEVRRFLRTHVEVLGKPD